MTTQVPYSMLAADVLAVIQTQVAASIRGVQGSFKNLKIVAAGLTNTSAVVTADEVMLESTTPGDYLVARSVSVTVNSASAGANGLDTGTSAGSTWYAVWVIGKADGTIAGLLSASATAPTMPTGYTYKARMGWVLTDGTANKYLMQTLQYGRRAQYVPLASSNTTAYPLMGTGAAGSPTVPTWVGIVVASFIPTTATRITLLGNMITSGGGGSQSMIAAPSNAYGATNSLTNPPPMNVAALDTGTLGISTGIKQAEMLLESTSIYWASSSASGRVWCMGWEDNI